MSTPCRLAADRTQCEHRAVGCGPLVPLTRREFLGALAAAAPFASAMRARARTRSLGIQLYTVRGLMARDPAGTLAALERIGYREVELAGLYGHSAADMHAMLGAHHLAAVSSHLTLDALRDNWPQCMRDARTLGQEYIVCSWIDEKERTADGYERAAHDLNAIGRRARDAGFQLCYHNGDYVHVALSDGTIPYDLLLTQTDVSLVQFEIDLYWLIAGGGDPLDYFTRYPGRFPMLHVKDRTAAGAMADVGAGNIDFKTILSHARAAGVQHLFVEHDEPDDPLASAKTSYEYLSRLDW